MKETDLRPVVSVGQSNPCPRCRRRGTIVKRVTLDHLIREELRAEIADGRYQVCAAPTCDVVYFGPPDARVFRKTDLIVPFGLKESQSPRPLCYCFEHTVEEIEDEIAQTGRSTVVASIKGDMKGAGCRCEYTNPLGGCCLKTVQAAVATALQSPGREAVVVADLGACRAGTENFCEDDMMADCCTTKKSDGTEHTTGTPTDCCETVTEPRLPQGGDRAGALAAGGSLLAAVFSSACCWLPLLLIAFGASAAGAAGFFEAYRPYFIIGAVGLLGVGFYRVYFRKERCEPGAACATPKRKLPAFNLATIWVAAVLVAAFVFFPNYVGAAFGAPATAATDASGGGPDASARLTAAEFNIEGMTCEGCANILRGALAKLPDVVAVDVDYPKKTAVVLYEADRPVSAARVIEAVTAAGYSAIPAAESP